MFFDVGFDRHEMLVDEVGCVLVGVRLGFQPSASASSRRRTEIEQDRAALLFRGGERLIHVSAPIHRHVHLLRDSSNARIARRDPAFGASPTTMQNRCAIKG